ncbi:glucose-1-phosphate cytidylyltransferase [Leptospira sp. 2 VSF19]|uniref:Glucose-1-phosphate cytidylyltransferase n=1 Tax=Leptospira soteropolitanensis TaxID=2950025 RepID=A0AAW5VFZ9_9LEPT|nr:glucose-1-phosphate cytidylyltransferase [Leptospira soteropolitanensis]MCW7493175.1 glucose-1-phosphate cytidylyltransferase [Leptospira soteropolitanensis]MCW7500756.1 glucose-1-phosphate cytidylyltransferase [Leptospira soteropolitanensis]MCW7523025.1 glucose-1-phosphate cytidylyltransferase [Leptospira soteropolitanensis]MCW7526868.1 glucose-1-phosphate cytidylyltransferase [Leptospira soteropolitanensis]MCW7530743.1 glucose-1-phosphate cytidylyltransferase [Leptospira soteropolitanensi
MKTIILAGGFGTRLAEYTDVIPKPMVTIGNKPMLWHIMKSYSFHGYKDFVLALGYKAELVKDYFLNYYKLSSDFTVNLKNGEIDFLNISEALDWKVTLVDTGLKTLTGGRVKRLKEYIGNQTFMLTYGDGLSNVNIAELVKFHKSHGKMVTVTAVHPSARFGELEIHDSLVKSFQEKPQTNQGWINGGYFVINPDFFDLIEGDQTLLEKDPLELAAKKGELMAFQHDGFWQCMDTKRDRDYLEELWKAGAPWIKT